MKQRNYGIDLLRIIAMFFVVIFHMLLTGGVLESVETNINFAIGCVLIAIVGCAIDCYALTTGYVWFSEEKKPLKFSKYISMWFLVEFYSLFGYLIIYCWNSKFVNIKELVRAIFPVLSKQYWYFSAYTGLFFMIPLLNRFVRNMKLEMLKKVFVCIGIISCLCVLSKCFATDPFGLNNGASFLWLAILYVLGACIKKFDIPNKVKIWNVIKIAIFCIVFSAVSKFTITKLTNYFFGKTKASEIFLSATSPTMLCIALSIFMICVRMTVKEWMKKTIEFLASSAFSVYLFHEHLLIREMIMVNQYNWIAKLNAFLMLIALVANALLIFGIGIFIDKIRILIFRLLRIDKLSQNIERKIETIVAKFKVEEKQGELIR